MPAADNLTDFTTVTEFSAIPQDTFSDAALIGTAPTAEEPTAGFNQAVRYTDPANVATDFTEGSDVHEAAKQAAAEGAQDYAVIVAEEVTHTDESIAGVDTVATEGTVANVPIASTSDVTVSVDGTALNTSAVTTSPPVWPGDEETIPMGEAVVNYDTGEVLTGTESGGTGTGGITVTYSTIDWTGALAAAGSVDADIVAMADHRFGRDGIGDADEIVTWCDANDAAFIMPYTNGATFETARDGMEEAWDIGAYVRSRFALPIASESADELGGAFAGRFAVNDAGYNIFLKTMDVQLPGDTRYHQYIGTPSTPGTFEGGRPPEGGAGGSDSGIGPANVLHNSGGAVLSNSLSTAGLESPYRYLDVGRRIAFLKDRARSAVNGVFRDNNVAFDEFGREEIRAAIDDAVLEYVGGRSSMFQSIEPEVPEASTVAQNARANRKWTGITLLVTLTTPVHQAGIEMRVSL